MLESFLLPLSLLPRQLYNEEIIDLFDANSESVSHGCNWSQPQTQARIASSIMEVIRAGVGLGLGPRLGSCFLLYATGAYQDLWMS